MERPDSLRFLHQMSTLNQGLRQKGISRGPLKTHLQKTEIILFMA